jgi:hypothetical protein
MAYKVLGQTLTTAASANIVVNLIKDPSFEGITRAMTGAATSTASVWESVAGTQWYYQNQNNSYYSDDKFGDISQLSTFANNPGVTYSVASSRYGNKVVAWGSLAQSGNYSSDNYLAYGFSTSTSGDAESDSAFGGVARAIPVTGSTTYYFGCDVIKGTTTTSYFKVLWFDSTGTYISNYNTSGLMSSTSSSSWTRKNFSSTSPSNAAYAAIVIKVAYIRQTQLVVAMDGIYFGAASSAASAFPDPSTGGTNSTLTAPFTGRFTSTWSGTTNNSTTVQNYAGAATDLYTVPAGKEAVISTITVANPTLSATSYRVGVVKSGETLALKNWIAFDIPLAANATTTLTLGITLATGDKIVVSNDTGQVSFAAFGSEN